MADLIRCDGGCGAESPDPKTRLHVANHWMKILVKTKDESMWRRHCLCGDCAKKNVFLHPDHGEYVQVTGFARDVLK
jgi:hypothetical protein